MIEEGKQYKSHAGHKVTVNRVCGDIVYYSDDFGCHYHKEKRFFAGQYISNAVYYAIKGEPNKMTINLN